MEACLGFRYATCLDVFRCLLTSPLVSFIHQSFISLLLYPIYDVIHLFNIFFCLFFCLSMFIYICIHTRPHHITHRNQPSSSPTFPTFPPKIRAEESNGLYKLPHGFKNNVGNGVKPIPQVEKQKIDERNFSIWALGV